MEASCLIDTQSTICPVLTPTHGTLIVTVIGHGVKFVEGDERGPRRVSSVERACAHLVTQVSSLTMQCSAGCSLQNDIQMIL